MPCTFSLILASPKAREFEKDEIQKMLSMYAIKPALTEWASRIAHFTLAIDTEKELSDDTRLVPDSVHEQVYRVVGHCYDLLDFWTQIPNIARSDSPSRTAKKWFQPLITACSTLHECHLG